MIFTLSSFHRKEWRIILLGMIWQYVHSVSTNFVYWLSKDLSDCQREPLYDLGYELFPRLRGSASQTSEVLVNIMFGIVSLLLLSPFFLRLRPPHGRTVYFTIVFRRIMACLIVLQTLRIISFLVTILPGAASHCRLDSNGWDPPDGALQIFFRMDAVHGCGDLMFSSHTIFTMLIVLVTIKYFSYPVLIILTIIMQTTIVPLIIASRKHYSVDVFTALYVVPMWWLLFDKLDPDPSTLTKYDIEFTDSLIIIDGEEHPIH